MKWKIGNVEIKNQVVLAPMAGICNSAYRTIIKDMGCGLIFAEMVSDKAIFYNSKKTIDMLYMTDYERPIAQQIFGSDKESFIYAAKYIYENMKPDIIDINMGCPVPKVALRAQAGSALLKDPDKVYEIVKSVVDAVPIPVTVKIRSGWDNNHINAVEISKVIEKAGAMAITVHPRTRSQGYSGKADWNIIAQVKEAVTIPVIASGDIFSAEDAIKCLEQTKCDGLMLARGVRGNPWLFAEIKQALMQYDAGEEIQISKPQLSEVVEMIRRHGRMQVEYKGETMGMREMRKHIAWYTTGYPHSAAIRREANFIETYEQLEKLCDKLLQATI